VDSCPATKPKKRLRPHFVPLPTQAVAILQFIENNRQGNSSLVFPSKLTGGEIAAETIAGNIPEDRFLQEDGAVPHRHGFRTSFCGWSETHEYPDKITQYCIAHVGGDKSFQAYMREECLLQRQKQLQDWSDFCHSVPTIESPLVRKWLKTSEKKREYAKQYQRKRKEEAEKAKSSSHLVA
jgi:hypothetical protein